MKELKLGMNLSFYLTFCALTLAVVIVDLLASMPDGTTVSLVKSLVPTVIILVLAIALFNTVNGKCKAVFCSQGLYYQNFLGKNYYVPFEEITKVTIEKVFWCNFTKVHKPHGNIRIWTFTPTQKQLKGLRALGYAE
ncbi:hypothetical protein ACSLBF_18025 (plasmid) [Pseudoalteromonas sp. T1lg65]|uniref:hypothetical protein n=1 Tax=Pseudoalteromonas sp. T1lg65 TaxID=2077101 RepID=UPI003F79FFD4